MTFRSIYLETTTVCNLRCPMCPRFGGEETASMPTTMPTEVFENLRPYLPQLHAMALVGCGEPTTDGRLLEFVREVSAAGGYPMFTTNGMLLDETLSTRIIGSGLKLLGVSVDGASAGIFERVRAGASFSRVIANVRHFMQLRSKLGTRPLVKLQIVLMVQNLPELPAVVELAADLGVEELYAKNLCFLRSHELISESLQEEYNPSVDTRRRDAYIETALRVASLRKVRTVLPSYERVGQPDCPYHPTDTLFIRRNGNVFPCPIYAVWNYGVERDVIEGKRMGNVLCQSLNDIWETKRYRDFRENFAAGLEQLCRGCTVWRQGYQQYSPLPHSTYIY